MCPGIRSRLQCSERQEKSLPALLAGSTTAFHLYLFSPAGPQPATLLATIHLPASASLIPQSIFSRGACECCTSSSSRPARGFTARSFPSISSSPWFFPFPAITGRGPSALHGLPPLGFYHLVPSPYGEGGCALNLEFYFIYLSFYSDFSHPIEKGKPPCFRSIRS